MLTSIAPEAFAQFGSTVSINGNTVAVSAIREDMNGNNAHGAVYVYQVESGNWELQKKLLPSDGDVNTFVFGINVCIDGNVIGICGGGGFIRTSDPADYLRQLYIFRKE